MHWCHAPKRAPWSSCPRTQTIVILVLDSSHLSSMEPAFALCLQVLFCPFVFTWFPRIAPTGEITEKKREKGEGEIGKLTLWVIFLLFTYFSVFGPTAIPLSVSVSALEHTSDMYLKYWICLGCFQYFLFQTQHTFFCLYLEANFSVSFGKYYISSRKFIVLFRRYVLYSIQSGSI